MEGTRTQELKLEGALHCTAEGLLSLEAMRFLDGIRDLLLTCPTRKRDLDSLILPR
jgi:hypothetical protein